MSSRSNRAAAPGVLALAGLLAVLLATLWPFRFAFRPLTWAAYAQSFGVAPRTLLDLPRNVVLFIPLGLGLAAVLRARGHSPRRTMALTIGAAAAVTVTVESLQVFLPGRTPNLSDLAGNIGGAAAALLALRVMDRRHADGGRRRLRLPAGVALLAAMLVVAGAVSWTLMRSMRPGGWTASALRVADERVRDVVVLDRAIDDATAARLLRGERPDDLAASIVARRDSTSSIVDSAGRRIDASGQFTVAFTAVAAERRQPGRSPLAALGDPAATDDLVLVQDEGRFIVSWRSPLTGGNHLAPELHFPNVFDADGPTRVVLSVDGATARVRTTTGTGNDDLFLAPDVVFTAIVRETNIWPLSIHHVAFWQSALLFAALVFVPAGALLWNVRRGSTWPGAQVLRLAGFVLPAVFYEGFVAWYRTGPPRPVSIAVGITLTAMGFGLFALWRRTSVLAADDPDVRRR